MFVLNYLYFLIFVVLSIRFLTGGMQVVNHPFRKDQQLRLEGPEMFWLFAFSTGLFAFSAPAGLNISAIRLMLLEIFFILGLFIVKRKPIISFPIFCYLLYLIWLVIGLYYCSATIYGMRVILKYLYPFTVALFASSVVRDGELMIKCGLCARAVGIIALLLVPFPIFDFYIIPGVFAYFTARPIHYIPIITFSLALFYYSTSKKSNLFYAGAFAIPCVYWVFRTSIMGTIIAIMAFSFFKYKLKSLPIIMGILLLGVVAVFTVPSLKEKMFVDANNVTLEKLENGQLSKDNINSNARFGMWKSLENKFYKNKELTGSGTGSVQHYMYTHFVFGGLKAIHGDFVQQRCDNGLIGLILYALASLSIVVHCFWTFIRSRDSYIKIAAITAGASLFGVYATLYSDNVINYSMTTLLLPYGFYGMMLGLKKNLRKS